MSESTSPGPYGALHLGRGNYGQAIAALKNGERVARSGWNGKGMFVFMQIPANIDIEIVPKMQSLPQSVKDEFIARAKLEQEAVEATSHLIKGPAVTVAQSIKYSNQMAIVDRENNINGWVASSSDTLATDWKILD